MMAVPGRERPLP